MASEETWKKLKFFKPYNTSDNWGDPNAIDDSLLFALDDFRRFLGVPVYVTVGVADSGHSEKSYHYREQGACAVDVVIPGYEHGPANLVLSALRFGFTGLGWYPHWQYGGKTVGGLHLDMRPLKWEEDFTINYQHSRWIGVPNAGKLTFLPLTIENITTYGGKYGLIKRDLGLERG